MPIVEHLVESEPEAPRPMVSVAMITYNHEAYIAQAVESVLMQNTFDPYELVIGDDASSDATRDIIKAFQRSHPDRVRLLPPRPNLGPAGNLVRTWSACRGRYVALLEGDDYWISPHKLQRQVDFLTANPDCTMCFHNAKVVQAGAQSAVRNYREADQASISTIDDLWRHNFIPTCSVMYRSDAVGPLPRWFEGVMFADWALHLLHARHGPIGYLDDLMAVYRIHENGLFSGTSEVRQMVNILRFYDEVGPWFATDYARPIARGKGRQTLKLVQAYLGASDVPAARRTAWRAFRSQLAAGRFLPRDVIRVLLQVSLPRPDRRLARRAEAQDASCRALASAALGNRRDARRDAWHALLQAPLGRMVPTRRLIRILVSGAKAPSFPAEGEANSHASREASR
jgi:glycosyltransferase involved in cell wall biosynthesis